MAEIGRYLLTKVQPTYEHPGNPTELDIWQTVRPGYVLYMKTVWGKCDLIDQFLKEPIETSRIVKYIVGVSDDLEELMGFAAIESVDMSPDL